jgi:hypothetical protein
MKAMAVEKVPIKEETIMEEDIVSSVSPDRAVSSSIKTETPGRDDDLPFSRPGKNVYFLLLGSNAILNPFFSIYCIPILYTYTAIFWGRKMPN